MTAAEQYTREALRLASQAHHYTYGDGADSRTGAALAAEAQVYATLAVAAGQPSAVRAETLRDVLAEFAVMQAPDGLAGVRDAGAYGEAWQRCRTVVQAMADEALPQDTEPSVSYVYRATWHGTPLGTYATRDAARTHCMADATNNATNPTGLKFDWLGDESEPDAPYEQLTVIDGVQETTEYTVTRVEVATAYDPEADQ